MLKMEAVKAVKAIMFDWERTLYDSENQALFPETQKVLQYLSTLYMLVIVSLASDGNIGKRMQILRRCDIEKYFTAIYFARQDKDALFAITLSRLMVPVKEIAIVDDRVMDGVRWGNVFGATTIWLKRGKFMGEKPNKETGKPTYTISNLEDICSLHL